MDTFAGLYYLRARWYDPSVGRFLTKDQFPGFIEKPISTNRYIYVFNNPENFIDPSGNFFGVDDAFALLIGGAGGLIGQYASDIAQNISEGKTTFGIFVPRSNWKEYAVSTIGGAATGELVLYCSVGGPVAVGACAGAGSSATSIAKDLVMNRNVDWGGAALDAVVSGVTAGVVTTFPKVPGRYPKLFTQKFFFGQHAQREWVEEAVSVTSSYIGDIGRELVKILAQQQAPSTHLIVPVRRIK